MGSDLVERLEARLEDIYLATELIQEAKGTDGPKGGYVTDHLDAAENHLDKVRESLVEAAARIRELEALLKPFAKAAAKADASFKRSQSLGFGRPTANATIGCGIRARHLYAARQALGGGNG